MGQPRASPRPHERAGQHADRLERSRDRELRRHRRAVRRGTRRGHRATRLENPPERTAPGESRSQEGLLHAPHHSPGRSRGPRLARRRLALRLRPENRGRAVADELRRTRVLRRPAASRGPRPRVHEHELQPAATAGREARRRRHRRRNRLAGDEGGAEHALAAGRGRRAHHGGRQGRRHLPGCEDRPPRLVAATRRQLFVVAAVCRRPNLRGQPRRRHVRDQRRAHLPSRGHQPPRRPDLRDSRRSR